MLIGIIDTSIANIGSLSNILTKIGCKVLIINKYEDFVNVDAIIIPGVGSFPTGKKSLDDSGLSKRIISFALKDKKPILGICLGMHLLMEIGFEYQETFGLNLFEGAVEKSRTNKNEQNIHMGWNSVDYDENFRLFKNIPQGTDFYFVHSYQVITNSKYIKATTQYGNGVVASIAKNNIYGVQFHPEKSQKYGKQLLINFVSLTDA